MRVGGTGELEPPWDEEALERLEALYSSDADPGCDEGEAVEDAKIELDALPLAQRASSPAAACAFSASPGIMYHDGATGPVGSVQVTADVYMSVLGVLGGINAVKRTERLNQLCTEKNIYDQATATEMIRRVSRMPFSSLRTASGLSMATLGSCLDMDDITEYLSDRQIRWLRRMRDWNVVRDHRDRRRGMFIYPAWGDADPQFHLELEVSVSTAGGLYTVMGCRALAVLMVRLNPALMTKPALRAAGDSLALAAVRRFLRVRRSVQDLHAQLPAGLRSSIQTKEKRILQLYGQILLAVPDLSPAFWTSEYEAVAPIDADTDEWRM